MQKNNAYEQFFDVVEVLQAVSEWESKKDALAKVGKSRSWLNDLDRRWTLSVKKALEIAEEYGENYLETKPQIDCILKEIDFQVFSPEYKWREILIVTLVWIIGALFIVWALKWYAMAIGYLLSLI